MKSTLQAEKDRENHARVVEILKEEERIMKDVPNWKVGESVYSSRNSVPVLKHMMDGSK